MDRASDPNQLSASAHQIRLEALAASNKPLNVGRHCVAEFLIDQVLQFFPESGVEFRVG